MAGDFTNFVEPTKVDGFTELIGALKQGNTWIKISAPYRCSDVFHTYDDLEDIVTAFVKANRRRTLWGSDWPHTQRHKDRVGKSAHEQEPFLKIDNRAWIQSLSRWLDEEEWHRMWVDNPKELYDLAI